MEIASSAQRRASAVGNRARQHGRQCRSPAAARSAFRLPRYARNDLPARKAASYGSTSRRQRSAGITASTARPGVADRDLRIDDRVDHETALFGGLFDRGIRAGRASGSCRSRSWAARRRRRLRALEVGEDRAAVGDQVSAVASAPGLSVTKAHGALAPLRVGPRDHGGLEHRRVAVERALDLDRGDVLAARDDDVLGAVLDLAVAVLVHHREVAGVVPAARERLGGRRRGSSGSPSSRCCRAA